MKTTPFSILTIAVWNALALRAAAENVLARFEVARSN